MEVLMRKDLMMPVGRINQLSIFNDFDRIFDHVFGNMAPIGQQNSYPVCNVFVDKDEVLNFEFALAGFKKEEVVAEVEDNILTVKAEKLTEETDNKYIIRKFARRAFSKQYNLGDVHDPDTALAKFEDGVLTITFQKKVLEQPENKVKRLEI